MDTNQPWRREPQLDTRDRGEEICGSRWETVPCWAKALFELNVWRKRVCVCWGQRDERRRLCLPRRSPFLREMYLAPAGGNSPLASATTRVSVTQVTVLPQNTLQWRSGDRTERMLCRAASNHASSHVKASPSKE